MAFSQVVTSPSLHFAKISLHLPKLQGETGSMGAASTTTHSIRTGVSWSLTNSAHFAGVSAGASTGCAVSAAGRGRDNPDFGSRSLGSPNPFLAPVRQDQIDKSRISATTQ